MGNAHDNNLDSPSDESKNNIRNPSYSSSVSNLSKRTRSFSSFGFTEKTLSRGDLETARKFQGADIAYYESAVWSQPCTSELPWDDLYSMMTSE